MHENEALEMISAYVLGCIDKNNYELIKEYSKNRGGLSLKEFGEIQNIAALIPTLLDIVEPDIKLKDAVAKNILSYQSEIKNKIRIKKTLTNSKLGDKSTKDERDLTIDENKEALKEGKSISKEFSSPKRKKFSIPDNPFVTLRVKKELVYEEIAQPAVTDKIEEETEIRKDKKPLTIEDDSIKSADKAENFSKISWVVFLVLLLLALFFAIYFYVENSELNSKISTMNREILTLKADLRKNSNYIKASRGVIDFLHHDDLEIVNLHSLDNSMDADGKLFISFNSKEAFLNAENLPPLKPGTKFQLWLITKDISYPLLKFDDSPNDNYYSMPRIPFVPKDKVDLIRVTIEPDTGSEYPTGNTILYGGFSK